MGEAPQTSPSQSARVPMRSLGPRPRALGQSQNATRFNCNSPHRTPSTVPIVLLTLRSETSLHLIDSISTNFSRLLSTPGLGPNLDYARISRPLGRAPIRPPFLDPVTPPDPPSTRLRTPAPFGTYQPLHPHASPLPAPLAPSLPRPSAFLSHPSPTSTPSGLGLTVFLTLPPGSPASRRPLPWPILGARPARSPHPASACYANEPTIASRHAAVSAVQHAPPPPRKRQTGVPRLAPQDSCGPRRARRPHAPPVLVPRPPSAASGRLTRSWARPGTHTTRSRNRRPARRRRHSRCA